MVLHTIQRGRRDIESITTIRPGRFDVVVDDAVADEASRLLGTRPDHDELARSHPGRCRRAWSSAVHRGPRAGQSSAPTTRRPSSSTCSRAGPIRRSWLVCSPPNSPRPPGAGDTLIGSRSVRSGQACWVGAAGLQRRAARALRPDAGRRRPDSPFPTRDGILLANDASLAAIGAALVIGGGRRG